MNNSESAKDQTVRIILL